MDKIEIQIESFSRENLISNILSRFIPLSTSVFEADDYIVLNFPFGRMVYSTLNTGLTVGLLDFDTQAPGMLFRFSGHNKDVPYKIGFCLKGKYFIDYKYENLHEVINQGQSLITAPTDGSKMSTPCHEPISFLYIFISQSFLNNYFNIKPKYLNQAVARIRNSDFLFAKATNSVQMNLAISEIFKADSPDLLSKIIIESKTLELLSLFFQHFSSAENNISVQEKNIILGAHKYILENLAESITVQELLDRFGTNEHKLQKGFKTLFGTTVKKHIRKLKIQKARRLILRDNCSVSEAGFEVGYSNLSHFTSAFRQEYGVLPSDLKKP